MYISFHLTKTICCSFFLYREEIAESVEVTQLWQAAHPVGSLSVFSANPTIIQTYIHIINPDENEVKANEAYIEIDHLNVAFMGSGFQFELVEVFEHQNDSWWTALPSNDRAMKEATRKGDCKSLNIWYNNPSDGLSGWATFPSWCGDDLGRDGVVCKHSTKKGGTTSSYNEGDTLVHDVGHWMGLYHTFEGYSKLNILAPLCLIYWYFSHSCGMLIFSLSLHRLFWKWRWS